MRLVHTTKSIALLLRPQSHLLLSQIAFSLRQLGSQFGVCQELWSEQIKQNKQSFYRYQVEPAIIMNQTTNKQLFVPLLN